MTTTEHHNLATIIETAAKVLNVCPHAVLLGRKRSKNDRAAIGKRCTMAYLYDRGMPVTQLCKMFQVTDSTVTKHIRMSRLMADTPTDAKVHTALAKI